MTNEELRQLDAEADAYQQAADQLRAPLYNQEAMDRAKYVAHRDGRAEVLDLFNKPPGQAAHLPEHYQLRHVDGPHFRVTREWEEADESVGIQAWDYYLVEPQGHIRHAIEEWEQLRNLEALVRKYRNLTVAESAVLEELDAIRRKR